MAGTRTKPREPRSGKSLIKVVARAVGFIRAFPLLLWLWLCRPIFGRSRALVGASENISRVPGLLGVFARQAFYRRAIAGLGDDVYIGFGTLMSKPEAAIGDRVYIGRYCMIGRVIIEPDVMIADGVQVLSGARQHGSTPAKGPGGHLMRDNPHTYKEVIIGRGAWIGANAVVMADVGNGAIVGAGAVVTRPVAAGEKVAGVPARSIVKMECKAA